MKLFHKLFKGLLYAGLGKDEYNYMKKEYQKSNVRILLWLSVAVSITMGLLGIVTIAMPNFVGYSGAYFLTAAGTLFIVGILLTGAKNNSAVVHILMYVFFTIMYAVATYGEALHMNEFPSVAMIVFVVVLPVAFSDRPIFTSGYAMIFASIYLVITMNTKSREIWIADLFNMISFGSIGLVLNLLTNKFKITAMLLESQNNSMHGMLEKRNREFSVISVALKSGDWTINLDKNGNPCGYEWSNEVCRLIGYRDTDDMPSGLGTWFDMIHEADRDRVYEAFKNVISNKNGNSNIDAEFRMRDKEGKYLWFRIVARLICDDDGTPVSVWGLMIDVNNKKNGEMGTIRQLAIVEALSKEYKDVFIINLDADRTITVKTNGEMVTNFADHVRKYEGMWEKYTAKYVHPDDAERVLKTFDSENVKNELAKSGEITCSYRIVYGDAVHHYQVTYILVPGTEAYDSFIVCGYRNVDSIVEAEEEYKRNLQAAISEANETKAVLSLVEIDDLTGAYTRQAFLRRTEEILTENPDVKYDLLITDFEDFKIINDQYGTKIGDNLIKWFGGYLKETLPGGIVVGRYSGDQFAILIESSRIDEMKDVVGKITGEIHAPMLPTAMCKIGIYIDVNHGRAASVLCDRAHMALNSIKHKYGKNYALYDDKIKKQIETQRRIELSMYQAVNERQFKVYYQPKHNSVTNEVIGAEALIRWEHPEFGFMAPGDFIPLFEKNGFITETDCYVWARTCENLRDWIDRGIKVVPISVNASRIDFLHNDFIDRLDASVVSHSIPKNLLHIEVTETLMTEEIDSLAEALNKFKDKGYQIELDDFGVGYSSLNILSSLPIDIVKLDMSFMKHFKDRKKSKILAACIDLAKNLGLKTISEGVETKEQIDMLNGMGVDSVQGYYYSKPLPEEEFVEYLKHYAVTE